MKRIVAIILSLSMLMTLVGCGDSGEEVAVKREKAASVAKGTLQEDSTVIAVGNTKVTYREYLIYSYLLRSKYDSMLTKDVWNYNLGEGHTVGTEAIEEIVRLIIQLKVISKAAAAQNVSVAVDDREDIAFQVEQYMKNVSDEEKDKYGLTAKALTDVLADNELARMMYDIVTGKVDVNVTDEQAKTAKVQMIYLMSKGTDKDGQEVNLDAAGKSALYEQAVSLQKQAKQAGNFYSLAEENSALPQVDFLLGVEDTPTDIVNASFSLKQNQISEVITTDNGFYIIKCISINDAEAVKQHRDEVISERQTKTFQASYENWAENYEVRVSKSLLGQELS